AGGDLAPGSARGLDRHGRPEHDELRLRRRRLPDAVRDRRRSAGASCDPLACFRTEALFEEFERDFALTGHKKHPFAESTSWRKQRRPAAVKRQPPTPGIVPGGSSNG